MCPCPHGSAGGSLKDIFYEQLDKAYGSLPSYDVKIVLGDFNAQLGKDDDMTGTVGKHSLHTETNDNGVRLASFAASRNMAISSTFFPIVISTSIPGYLQTETRRTRLITCFVTNDTLHISWT
ncbi:hypothetical protein BGY98DRAFT_122249 [Russula aff. rugulosa BPL654]|nr:hypothetical protein BGY98DRAFT_122249 [Russula aff. rugulosa BPL654]